MGDANDTVRPARTADAGQADTARRMDDLESAVRRLERANRRMRRLLGSLAGAVLLGTVLALAPVQTTVEARAFVVRDEAGRPRAQLGVSDGIPALSLYDPNGTLRAALAVDAEGPILNLFAPGGVPRAVLAERLERSFLVLRDVAGTPRAAMAVQETGEPSLYLLGEDLTPLWRQPAEPADQR